MGWHGMSSNVATPYKTLFKILENWNFLITITLPKLWLENHGNWPIWPSCIHFWSQKSDICYGYLGDFVVPRKILGPRFLPSNLSGAWEAGCFQALVADCTQSFLHNFECSKQLLGIWTWAMVSINVNHVYKRRIKDRRILQICEERAVRKTNLLGLYFQRVASQTSWKGQS